MLGKRDFRHNISMCVCEGGGGGRIRGKTKTALGACECVIHPTN